ncbi:MAG: carboxypeptidase-like regulatory domain-containing protein [Armatimonadota bacterium]
MKRGVSISLFLVMLLIAGSCAHAVVRFIDNFDVEGPDPTWSVTGSFVASGGKFVPGAGYPDVALAKNGNNLLALNNYTMTCVASHSGGSATYFSIRIHQKDADNYLRLFFSAGEKRFYWQAVVNGVGKWDPPKYPAICTNLNWASITVTVVYGYEGATATVTDGTNTFSTSLPIGEIPDALKGASYIGIDHYNYDSGTVFDSVVIDDFAAQLIDNFDGDVLKYWDVSEGSFTQSGGKLVPGAGYPDVALAKDDFGRLWLNFFTIRLKPSKSGGGEPDYFAVRVHQNDAGEFMRVCCSSTSDTIYWQTYAGGNWVTKSSVDCSAISWSNANLTLTVEVKDTGGAVATVFDGTNSSATTLAYADWPLVLRAPGYIGIEKTFTTTGLQFDDVQIGDNLVSVKGGLSGNVKNSLTSANISGVIVDIPAASLSTTTDANGNYSFAAGTVPTGQNTVRVHLNGYIAQTLTLSLASGESRVQNYTLEPVGLDQARSAFATSSITSLPANYLNDGSCTTGWGNKTGISSGNEWIKLTWDSALTIKSIVIDVSSYSSSVATPSCVAEYSLNDSTWTNIANYSEVAAGNTHKLLMTTLGTAASMKYLRVRITGAGTSVGYFFSVEAYKSTGTADGYVKYNGNAVNGATVCVTEPLGATYSRGPGRKPITGTTNASGYYSIAVPEGRALVSAWANDSDVVTSTQVTITAGSTTNVSQLNIARRSYSATAFSDSFTLANGSPDAAWSNSAWVGSSNTYKAEASAGTKSLVNTPSNRDGVYKVDKSTSGSVYKGGFGMITRCHTWPDSLLLLLDKTAYTPKLAWYESLAPIGSAIDAPVNLAATLTMRVVLMGDQGQGFINDGNGNTYWTGLMALSNLATGQMGLYDLETDQHRFDNYSVASGTGPAPPDLTIDQLRTGGAGSFGYLTANVTAVFPDYKKFVVENPDGSDAMTVTPIIAPVANLPEGKRVKLLGSMQADGTFKAAEITYPGSDAVVAATATTLANITVDDWSTTTTKDKLIKTSTSYQVKGTPIVNPYDGSKTFYISDNSSGGTAQVENGYTDAFSDDFNTGSKKAGWYDYQGTSSVVNYALHLAGSDSTANYVCTSTTIQDSVIEQDVVSGTGEVGLLFRFANMTNYAKAVWVPASKRIYFVEVTNGTVGPLLGDYYYSTTLSLPVNMSVETRDNNVKCRLSDGTNMYWTSATLIGPLDPYVVGVYHNGNPSGNTDIDNFASYYANAPLAINDSYVQVTIPGSVTGTMTVNDGDYVWVRGIAGHAETLQGSMRGIMIRKAGDLTTDGNFLASVPKRATRAETGSAVSYVQGYVTAVFNDYDKFVIESADRSAATMIAPLFDTLDIGQEVRVQGSIQGDGTFKMVDLTKTGYEMLLQPICMDLDGSLNTKNLLISVEGTVIGSSIVNPDGSTTFYITNDVDIVPVVVPASVTEAITVTEGDYVVVTGIVCEGSMLQGVPRGIVIRTAEDLSK